MPRDISPASSQTIAADDPAIDLVETHADLGHAAVAGQWRLAWWKFRRHKLALISGIVVICIYLVAIFADVLAPADPEAYVARYTYAPPQMLHLFDDGRFSPYVTGFKVEIDADTLRRTFVPDEATHIPVGFFVHGAAYRLWGFIPLDIHLIGPLNAGDPMYLWGADRLGRDMLSRVIFGTRVSMSIGLVGVGLSLIFGIVLGGISGFFGGWVDVTVQRVIEFLLAIPTIPLWMGMAAAIPATVPPLQVYFLITVILSVVGWTGLARVIRGRFLALKSDDFVVAARLDGASEMGIILRHMVPSFASHIIASVTLAIPVMILSETSLSFLGIGLRPPVVSWGVLLQEAQNIRAVASAPWLLLPGVAVIIAVLSLNFLGDGLRDAADPYES
jgi:peptide/nickel transport system permease protein